MKVSLAALALLGSAVVASAQTRHFEAIIGPDGEVHLVPRDNHESSASTDGGPILGRSDHTSSNDSIFVLTDPTGEIKAVYKEQAQALDHELAPGEAIKAYPANDQALAAAMTDFIDEEYWRDVAKAAAQQLMQEAKDSACAFDVRPESITPSVEVGFSAGLGGGSLSVSATWLVRDLCTGD